MSAKYPAFCKLAVAVMGDKLGLGKLPSVALGFSATFSRDGIAEAFLRLCGLNDGSFSPDSVGGVGAILAGRGSLPTAEVVWWPCELCGRLDAEEWTRLLEPGILRVTGTGDRVSSVSGVSCCSIRGVNGNASTMLNPEICRPRTRRRSLPSLSGVAGLSTRGFLRFENDRGRLSTVRLSSVLAVAGKENLSSSATPD